MKHLTTFTIAPFSLREKRSLQKVEGPHTEPVQNEAPKFNADELQHNREIYDAARDLVLDLREKMDVMEKTGYNNSETTTQADRFNDIKENYYEYREWLENKDLTMDQLRDDGEFYQTWADNIVKDLTELHAQVMNPDQIQDAPTTTTDTFLAEDNATQESSSEVIASENVTTVEAVASTTTSTEDLSTSEGIPDEPAVAEDDSEATGETTTEQVAVAPPPAVEQSADDVPTTEETQSTVVSTPAEAQGDFEQLGEQIDDGIRTAEIAASIVKMIGTAKFEAMKRNVQRKYFSAMQTLENAKVSGERMYADAKQSASDIQAGIEDDIREISNDIDDAKQQVDEAIDDFTAEYITPLGTMDGTAIRAKEAILDGELEKAGAELDSLITQAGDYLSKRGQEVADGSSYVAGKALDGAQTVVDAHRAVGDFVIDTSVDAGNIVAQASRDAGTYTGEKWQAGVDYASNKIDQGVTYVANEAKFELAQLEGLAYTSAVNVTESATSMLESIESGVNAVEDAKNEALDEAIATVRFAKSTADQRVLEAKISAAKAAVEVHNQYIKPVQEIQETAGELKDAIANASSFEDIGKISDTLKDQVSDYASSAMEDASSAFSAVTGTAKAALSVRMPAWIGW